MPLPRRTTLADIARAAGVHVTTVSLALRNHPRLPETTKSRIRALAEKLGYAPDPMLRALVTYRSNSVARRQIPTLAYITNWNTRWGWKKVTAHPEFHKGAEAKAVELGYKLDHFWLREPGLTHGRLSQILKARSIHGLIIASHVREWDESLGFDWTTFSAVKIDYFPHQPVLHNVTNHQCDIVRLAMRHVMAAGYRRIGMVMDRGWDESVDDNYTAGFLCEQRHLAVRDRLPVHYFLPPAAESAGAGQSGAATVADPVAFQAWFEKYRPQVLISKQEFVLPLLKKLNLRIPRDVAFVDLFLGDYSGAVAGVRQNHETVGALAVEILAGQLQTNKFGVPAVPTTTFVEGTWFDGATCPALA